MKESRRLDYDVTYMRMTMQLRPLSYAIRSKVGCIIVSDDDQIIAQGYNGMPKGFSNVCENKVWNEVDKKYELVTKPEVLHAESNAIAKCAKFEASSNGATAYISLSPCLQCSKLLIQAGIKRVVFAEEYRDLSPISLLVKSGIQVQLLDLLHKTITSYLWNDMTSSIDKTTTSIDYIDIFKTPNNEK